MVAEGVDVEVEAEGVAAGPKYPSCGDLRQYGY